jgi:hypothetical protein
MANCNNLFKHYNESIRLSDSKRQILLNVRDSLRHKMRERHAIVSVNEQLEFHTQGSFVMDTIITPKDEDFDLDDGVYFLGSLRKEIRPSPEKFHGWVLNAIGHDENYGTVEDKDTCVRVTYKKEKFHIDLPIYYADNIDHPDLAHKLDGWILSNPIEFIDWFENKAESGFQKAFLLESKMFSDYEKWTNDIRKNDAQLRRIVRYLKGWGDNLRGDMPPGIILTILAAENYSINERDDVCLKETLVNIKQYLQNNGFKCPRPTTPIGEDLFANYSLSNKNYFMERLETFITNATYALELENQKEACLKWQKHLGDRFPCSIAFDGIQETKQYSQPAIIGDTARSA